MGVEAGLPGPRPPRPWKSQTDAIRIDAEKDLISDSGQEIWSALEERGIKNVILLGVHTNMCVLGRPFGLRQMAQNGKNVVLMRDMTDTMYNPKSAPKVSHFSGTDLIVEYIEKYVCPTITSDQVVGGQPFRFQDDQRPHVVLVIAEDEYRTEESLPRFAEKYLRKDFRISYVFGDETERNDLPGIGVLKNADAAIISVRRRVLPRPQMKVIRDFVAAGHPMIGIRTASHAFALRPGAEIPDGYEAWPEFDAEVWGGNYHNHHGNGPKVAVMLAEGAADHPILNKVHVSELVGNGSLYKVSPLANSTTTLLIGSIPSQPSEPIAWTNTRADSGRSFYTSLGQIEDFEEAAFNQLLRNAALWATDQSSD